MPARKVKGLWRYQKVVRTPDGQKHRIFGTPQHNTRGDAERAEREHIAKLLAPAKTDSAPTFADFVPRYLAIAEQAQAPSEIAAKRQRLVKIILPQIGHLRLDQIGRAELDAIKLLLKGRSPRTVNNYLAVVGAVLSYAVELELVSRKPTMGMLHVGPQDYEEYTDQEIDALVSACADVYERCAILLGADAGLRAGEIRALRREDVAAFAGKIRVHRSEWFGHDKAPKSGRGRVIPVTPRLEAALTECLESHTAVKVLARSRRVQRGESWSREVMRERIAAICARAGVTNKGWHALRHAFCSRLAARGVPAIVIQTLAGHQSITTTQRYMHVAPDALESAVSVLSKKKPADNMVAKGRAPEGRRANRANRLQTKPPEPSES
jgi:integrase